MRRLIIGGLVYLTGIALVLLLKPNLMFHEDGRWKEFGIGRDPTYFTYIPFWLFTIIWSVLAYVVAMFIEESMFTPTEAMELPRNNMRTRNIKQANAVQALTPGYYMLNEGSTGRNGVPRYVYLGPAPGEGDE
jgi:hypothetical protein